MTNRRVFAWRTHKHLGGHLLEQRFATPTEAGVWRAEHFPGTDEAPLTLVALVDGEVERVTNLELADAHWAWLHPEAVNA